MPKVTITGTGSELQGVARLEDGRAVFVPFALPGDEVEIEIVRKKERYAQAQLKRVIVPSLARIKPDCPYYGVCGGCQARHMYYEKSLELKREKVYAALTRLGRLVNPLVLPTLPSPETNAYRNKAEFACTSNRLGVYQEGSASIIDTEQCLLHPQSINRILKTIKPRLQAFNLSGIVTRINSRGEIMLILCTSGSAKQLAPLANELTEADKEIKSVYACLMNPRPVHALDGRCVPLAGFERLDETLCDLTFSISPKPFFQVNRKQAERLYTVAMDFADLSQSDTVCDLYCGTGTITLIAAARCKMAIGIELVPEAISDAGKNAETNRLTAKTQFICADAAKAYPPLSQKQKFSAVFVDPPRSGLDKPVVEALIKAPTLNLVYVSCDPATLARDVRALTESGIYNFVKAQPVDMFPGTSHCESVVKLIRSDINP